MILRPTIFRAISIKTKKFVYGEYMTRWRGEDKGVEHYIVEHPHGSTGGREVLHKINNTTLGQFTSVVDRNSAMIFKNDIIRVFSGSKSSKGKPNKVLRTVKWGTTPDGVGFNVRVGDGYLLEIVSNIYESMEFEASL